MEEFPVIKATKQSLAQRKCVFGVGINDAAYLTQVRTDGRLVACPFYQTWLNMLRRCYSPVSHKLHPTYKGCSVCTDWLRFSVFRTWMMKQPWAGNHLDKDLIRPGNRVYCPAMCAFVSRQLNMLLTDHRAAKGRWPAGVCYHKKVGRFQAQCNYNGNHTHIGYFNTPEDASTAYQKRKKEIIREAAMQQDDPRVREGLLLRCI